MRVDWLHSAANYILSPQCKEGPLCTSNSQQTMHHHKRPIFHRKNYNWWGNHRRKTQYPQTISMTCEDLLWTGITMLTKTHSMGPHHWTPTRSPQHPTRTPPSLNTRRNCWSQEVRGETLTIVTIQWTEWLNTMQSLDLRSGPFCFLMVPNDTFSTGLDDSILKGLSERLV